MISNYTIILKLPYDFLIISLVLSVKFLGLSSNGANRRAACKSNCVSISKLLFIGMTTTPNLKIKFIKYN